VISCPNCGRENPDEAAFCMACATPLAPAAPARETRKTVTVLFCDLVGSATLAERHDPEVLKPLLRRYFDEMRAAAEMRERLAAFGEGSSVELVCRIGLTTGEVLVSGEDQPPICTRRSPGGSSVWPAPGSPSRRRSWAITSSRRSGCGRSSGSPPTRIDRSRNVRRRTWQPPAGAATSGATPPRPSTSYPERSTSRNPAAANGSGSASSWAAASRGPARR
jgi:hypothetical protein